MTITLLLAVPAAGERTGAIRGRVSQADGRAVEGVSVRLQQTGAFDVSDALGEFRFPGLAPGTYSLSLSLGQNKDEVGGIEVTAGGTATVDRTVDWELAFADTLTVVAASRRRERIVEAPAAVTALTQEEIRRRSAGGQLPKLLEFTPGAELTQSGVYYFNFNTRGFNSSLNRRVLTLIDGRDVSIPFLAAQEWAAISFPLTELAGVELVRGPGSALYGSDAFNGVLNLVTKAPQASLGGGVRLTGGELSTRKLDLRHAGRIDDNWFFKFVGTYAKHDDFTLSRNTSVEYSRPCAFLGESDCLPPEAFPLFLDQNEVIGGSLRIDRDLPGSTLTVEAGTAEYEGMTAVTPNGRLQVLDSARPWARVNYNTRHWNLMVTRTEREVDDLTALAIGTTSFLDSERTTFEIQGNMSFHDSDGFLVGGASYKEEEIDSANREGVQTLMFEAQSDDFQALFGQIEYSFTDRLKGVLAARWDDSSLYDARFSPRASLIYAVRPEHTLRLTYGEAFQRPNHAELFVVVDIAAPLPLFPFEAICAAEGASCGFDRPVRVVAVGNESLDPEEIRSIELGYSGIAGRNLFVTVDLYDVVVEDFLTDFISFIDPALGGRFNPNFPAWAPPSTLSPAGSALLLGTLAAVLPPPLFAILSNGPAGEPLFTALSIANFGRVEARGFDLALTSRVGRSWMLDFSYTYADYDIKEQLGADPILPNSPENRFSLGLGYSRDRLDVSLRYRYSEAFDWASGVFAGRVPSYDVTDLSAGYALTSHLDLGLEVNNLLDNVHYELFGGDLLTRRALVSLSYRW